MTLQEIKASVEALIHKAPNPQRIANIKTARLFKDAVASARKAKSLAAAQSALRTLETYYH